MQKIFILALTIAMTMTNVMPTIAATTIIQKESTVTSNESGDEANDLEGEVESTTGELPLETPTPDQPETTPDNTEDRTTVETPSVEVQEELITNISEDTVNPEKQDAIESGTPKNTEYIKYEKISAPMSGQQSSIAKNSENEETEFTLAEVNKLFHLEEATLKDSSGIEALSPITEQKFEVAVRADNGEYYFVEAVESYEDAVESAQTLASTITEESIVINQSGIVVYSNSNVARIYKQVNGSLYGKCDLNTNLYRDASLSTAVGYTNHCFGDDAAVLSVQGDAAQIMIAGKIAWVRISTDLVFVSPNQVVNPSYYTNENGSFVHSITKNLTKEKDDYGNNNWTKLNLGPVNPSLQNNVRYYSYDGKYFYTNPELIGPDMADGVANQAINANNPYYNYYQYLPFNSKAMATATQINAYINGKTQATSKLRNTGQAFIDAQEKYGINAMLMLGIAINESGWGMSDIAQEKNNIFGLNAIDATPGESADYFPSVAQCINDYASDWLAQGFADPQDWRYYGGMLGNKNLGLNVKYASDPYWSEKAVAHMYTVDRGINGGSSKEWNYYSIGIFTTPNSVKNASGQEVYPITAPDANGVLSLYSGYTETPIVLKETDSSDGKYLVWPARNNILSSSNNVPTALPYNWNGNEYVSSSGVAIVYKDTLNTAPEITAKDLIFTIKRANESNLLTGVTASDKEDGNVNVSIDSHTVDFNRVGTYQVTYKAIDNLGFVTKQTQKVTIVENEKPVISGAENTIIKVGEVFNSLNGVTASDKEDGNLTNKIKVTGSVDVTKIGKYTLTYQVSDTDGQSISKTRIITVQTNPNSDWEKSWAATEIAQAMRDGWILTTPEFRPEDTITRAEFIKVINKSFGFTESASKESFTDVDSSHWWYEEVLRAVKAGYISTEQSKFRPNDSLTREEAATIIARITKIEDTNHDKLRTYSDYKSVSIWAIDGVEGVIEKKYMGQGITAFRPKDKMTRAEAIVTVTRVN